MCEFLLDEEEMLIMLKHLLNAEYAAIIVSDGPHERLYLQ